MLIAVAILATLAWRLGTGAFLTGLRAITGPAALVAFGIGVLTTVCCALRWCVVARRLGLRLPFWTALTDYYRAMFLNVVLPMGVLGDVQRAVRHGQDSGDIGRGVRAVVLERSGRADRAVRGRDPARAVRRRSPDGGGAGIAAGALGLVRVAVFAARMGETGPPGGAAPWPPRWPTSARDCCPATPGPPSPGCPWSCSSGISRCSWWPPAPRA